MVMVSQLPIVERIRFHKLFKDSPQNGVEIDEYLTELRFSPGRARPICGGTHVQRNGRRRNGTQKFICKDCGKTFSIRKNSIFSGTRKPMSVWHKYMDCMAEGLTLDESAERCGISHKTAFTWRHKILDAMSKNEDGSGLDGIVEADETFLRVSYKGEAALFSSGEVERDARRHGGGSHKKGAVRRIGLRPMCHRPQGKRRQQGGQVGELLHRGSRHGSWWPYLHGIDTLQRRGQFLQEILKTQWPSACANKRRKVCERNLPHTAPERIPH